MKRRTTRTTSNETLFPYTTLFRSAVLAVSGPAAALAAQALRPGQPGAGGRRVHGFAVLGAGPCRSRARADVAAGAGHLDRLRRVPRRAHACRHRALEAVAQGHCAGGTAACGYRTRVWWGKGGSVRLALSGPRMIKE